MPAQVLIPSHWAKGVDSRPREDLLDELVYVWPYGRRFMGPLNEVRRNA